MEHARLYLLEQSSDTPAQWVIPELPALPPEVAIDVVRYARYRLALLEEEVPDSD